MWRCLSAFKQATALFLRFFYRDNFCCNFIAERPSFAHVVKNSKKVKEERLNCLNFKHRNVSKRNEATKFVKEFAILEVKIFRRGRDAWKVD